MLSDATIYAYIPLMLQSLGFENEAVAEMQKTAVLMSG